MLSYMVLAKLLPPGEKVVVPSGENIVFDTIMSDSGTDISYDLGAGIITFKQEGYYYIDWYVSPQTGLSDDGNNWAIKTSLSNLTFTGSSHAKISVATGFAILDAEQNETAQLVNVSDNALTLSRSVQSKAALSVYRVVGKG